MGSAVSWFGTIFKRFRAVRKVVASASAETDVTFGPITDDRLYLITRFSVEDETSDPTSKIRVGVAGHGDMHWLLEETSPSAATLYGDTWPTHLVQGESLVARFTNAVSGDKLVLYVEGYYLPEEPPSAILETAIFAGAGGVLPEITG
jgi:hypothetical protein